MLTYAPIESSRVGVLKGLVARAVTLGSHEGELVEVCHDTINFRVALSHPS